VNYRPAVDWEPRIESAAAVPASRLAEEGAAAWPLWANRADGLAEQEARPSNDPEFVANDPAESDLVAEHPVLAQARNDQCPAANVADHGHHLRQCGADLSDPKSRVVDRARLAVCSGLVRASEFRLNGAFPLCSRLVQASDVRLIAAFERRSNHSQVTLAARR